MGMGIIEAATVTLITMTIIVMKITISIIRRLNHKPEGEAGSLNRWVAFLKLLLNYTRSFGAVVWLWHSVQTIR